MSRYIVSAKDTLSPAFEVKYNYLSIKLPKFMIKNLSSMQMFIKVYNEIELVNISYLIFSIGIPYSCIINCIYMCVCVCVCMHLQYEKSIIEKLKLIESMTMFPVDFDNVQDIIVRIF